MLRQLARDEYVSPSRVDVTSALRQQLGRGSQIAVSPSFHGELMVDWNLLWHAISNALSNARKYGDKASIEVRLNYQPPDLVVTVVNSADAREQARLMAKHGQDATGLLQRRIEGGTALSSNLGSRAILQAAASTAAAPPSASPPPRRPSNSSSTQRLPAPAPKRRRDAGAAPLLWSSTTARRCASSSASGSARRFTRRRACSPTRASTRATRTLRSTSLPRWCSTRRRSRTLFSSTRTCAPASCRRGT